MLALNRKDSMTAEAKYQESELADANRKTSKFCRYKKTYYLALILFCLLLVTIVIGVYLQFFRTPSTPKMKVIPPPTAGAPELAEGSNFLQDLLNKLE